MSSPSVGPVSGHNPKENVPPSIAQTHIPLRPPKAPPSSAATTSSQVSHQEYLHLANRIVTNQKELDALHEQKKRLSLQLKQMQEDHREELRQRDEQHQAELRQRDEQHQAELRQRDEQHQAELQSALKSRDDRLAALERQMKLLLENRA